jgi:CMP-N,N'-diacetyllegionaminic acid synthase
MYQNKTFLAVIPARGGSKGIPGKNIKPLGGKPLIAWTIEAAKSCAYIDRVVVSTDDDKIAAVSRKAGAEVPVMRPAELATDEARSIDVVLHMMRFVEKEKGKYDYVVLLQPTSPFRDGNDLGLAVEYLISQNADGLVSFCKTKSNPHWMVVKKDDGTFGPAFDKKAEHHQRQNLPVFYEYNGAIYIARWENFISSQSFEKGKSLLFEMDSRKSVDLDTLEDWEYAEYLMKGLTH